MGQQQPQHGKEGFFSEFDFFEKIDDSTLGELYEFRAKKLGEGGYAKQLELVLDNPRSL